MTRLQTSLARIDAKKKQLDQHRPLPPELVKNLYEWFAIALTYNSNAIEGNTLSMQETALVVEKGLTIGGKTVIEHLEAINHAYALDFIKELSKKNKEDIVLSDILDIHRLILKGIDEHNAGCLRKISVRISGSDIPLPSPVKIPELMKEFIVRLHKTQEHPIKIAADAHLALILIHPFVDGNGRTARLLMNLLFMSAGYPPAIIAVADRKQYVNAISTAEKKGDATDFYEFIYAAQERSLDIFLDAAKNVLRDMNLS